MKFTVPVQTIIDPVTRVANICTANSNGNPDDMTLFVLFKVTRESLTLTGSDNNVQLKAVIPLPEGACESEGSFLMQASKANDFFKVLGSGDDVCIELNAENEQINIASGSARFSLRVRLLQDEASFPTFENDESAQEEASNFSIEEKKLRFMIDKSLFCVSRENFREYLKGVRFELKDNEMAVFALDGHRMAAIETTLANPVSKEMQFSMTLRGVTELQKLLIASSDTMLDISVTDSIISTSVGVFTISNRLLKCKYPNVRGVLPRQCEPEVRVELSNLKTYVKRVALFSNKRFNHINLTFEYNSLGIHSQNSDHEIGSAHIPIDFPEQDAHREVNLNSDYLKEFLGAIETDNVVFGFSPPYNNTMLRPDEEINEIGVRVRYVVSHIVV